MSPRTLFRGVAIAEAGTWAGLLAGMYLKYGPPATELGVQVFGPLHGVAFLAFCLSTILVGVDQQWRPRRLAVGLLSAVPPFATVAFDRGVERRRGLSARWRLTAAPARTRPERLAARLVRRPGQGLVAGAAAVGILTAAALVIGPPIG